jgi:hypothetical protein
VIQLAPDRALEVIAIALGNAAVGLGALVPPEGRLCLDHLGVVRTRAKPELEDIFWTCHRPVITP